MLSTAVVPSQGELAGLAHPRRFPSTAVAAFIVSVLISTPWVAAAQSTSNRASEYVLGERPWRQCTVEQTLEVDFEGTRRPYHAEWRRCGPWEAEWKPGRQAIDYPTHYVTVTRDAVAVTPLVVRDNAAESSLSYIQSVRRVQFTSDGRQQLAIVTGIYGTGAAWELCVLGLVKGVLACWELPDWRPAMAPLLAADEESWKSLLISVTDDRLLVEALIYDKAHDANCCPSRGSIFVELRPGDGRFDLGRVWRVAPQR